MELGLIRLDGKPYPVELRTYRRQDITDFSPRASLPGGQVMYAELGLYQSLTQDDWQYGFGFEWHIQNNAYLKTVGQVDTRQSGYIQRMTQPTALSDASSYAVGDYFLWDSDVWGFGSDGLIQIASDGDTCNMVFDQYGVNYAFHTGEYILVLPDDQQPYYSTDGSSDVVGKAFGYTQTGRDNADIFLQAVTGGDTSVVDIRLAYEGGGTTDPVITVATVSGITTITATMDVTGEAAKTCGSDVIAAINACSSAAEFVTASLRTGHVGSGKIPSSDPVSSDAGQPLALIGGSTNGTQAQLLIESTAANAALLYTAVPWGTEGNDYTIQYEDTGIAHGSEVIEVTGDAVKLSFDALTTADEAKVAFRRDQPTFATMTTNLPGDNNDLVYTAVTAGWEGNRIAITYQFDPAIVPGSESVDVDTDPSGVKESWIQPLITVSISPNTVASQVMDAVNNDATASTYVTVTLKPDETGAGKIGSEMIHKPLRRGTDDPCKDMVTVADGQGDNGTGVVEAFAAGHLQGGSGARSWKLTGLDSDAVDYSWGIVYDGYVYCGVQGTNRVHYTDNPDLRHLEGTSDDPGALYVGLSRPGAGSLEVIGAHVFAGQLLFLRQDGVWRMDKDRSKARNVLDYSDVASSENFRSWSEYQGQFVYTLRNELCMWNGVATNRITPGWAGLYGPDVSKRSGARTNVTWPYIMYGRFDNLTQVGRFLFCSARTNAATYEEHILCYDGVGWHKIAEPILTAAGTISAMIFNPADNRLYYHINNGTTAQTTYYIQLQELTDAPYDNYATTTDHYLLTSRYDGGFREITKSTPSVLIQGTNLSTEHWIEVYYSLDGADSWYPWGGIAGVSNVIDSDGITELFHPLGAENTTLEYKDIQYKVFLHTSASTGSPVLQRLTTRILMRPKTLWGWSFQIPVVKDAQFGTAQIDDRSISEIIDDIAKLRQKKSPVEFEDIWGTLYQVHITSMNEQAVNFISDNLGPSPSIEMRVNVSLAELG